MSEKEATAGKPLSWDDEIENDGNGFTLLPEGQECDFVVTKLEKGKSAALNAPMAILTVEASCELGSVSMRENLVLHTKMEWKICQFFTAIGQRKHGEKLRPDWSKVEGATGRCRLTVDTWTGRNGEAMKSNKVKEFLEAAVDASSAPADSDDLNLA